MSDSITTTKQKDPKKVEAGRRLGQMSKQIREQKMRAKIEAERETGVNYNYLIGIGGLILTGISILYSRYTPSHVSATPCNTPCHTSERHSVTPVSTPCHTPEPEPNEVSITYNSKLDRL